MKLNEAMEIINKQIEPGYIVIFEKVLEGSALITDFFPDIRNGEEPIKTKEEAEKLAKLFAEKTIGKCRYIYAATTGFKKASETIPNFS